jgi:hypothetical protein
MRIAEKAAIAISWAVTMAIGCTLLAGLSPRQSPVEAAGTRALLFAVLMTFVYVIGYQVYKHQAPGGASSSAPHARAYWPALKLAVLEQVIVVVLASLVLDFGRTLHAALVSVAAYWPAACIIVLRRPASPTRGDILLVKYGLFFVLLIVMTAGTVYWTWLGRWRP